MNFFESQIKRNRERIERIQYLLSNETDPEYIRFFNAVQADKIACLKNWQDMLDDDVNRRNYNDLP